MNFKEYQELASRTMNKNLKRSESEKHALHGLVGEVGGITFPLSESLSGA